LAVFTSNISAVEVPLITHTWSWKNQMALASSSNREGLRMLRQNAAAFSDFLPCNKLRSAVLVSFNEKHAKKYP